MPVRWTPENDKLLLMTILDTHDISLDTKRVAEAWRTEDKGKPTPRAISERLNRIRSDMKKAGGKASFSIGKGSTPTTPASTTAKSRVSKSTPKTPTPRRKRASTGGSALKKEKVVSDDEDDMEVDTPSKKPIVKKEDSAFAVEIESPKRERKQTVHLGMVDYPSDPVGDGEKVQGEGKEEASASDFVPDDSFDSGSIEAAHKVEG